MASPEPSAQLQARRRRVSVIRRRVLGSATGLFLASTAGIFVQLVSGHDPALARTETKAASVSTDTTTTAAASSPVTSSKSSSTSAKATGSSSKATGSSSSGQATAVTTSAS